MLFSVHHMVPPLGYIIGFRCFRLVDVLVPQYIAPERIRCWVSCHALFLGGLQAERWRMAGLAWRAPSGAVW